MQSGNKGFVRRAVACALDILFPAYCLCCDEEGQWVCRRCRTHLTRALILDCPLCHAPSGNGFLCMACRAASGIDQIISVFHFKQKGVQEIVHALKYENIRSIAPWMGRCMAASWELHGSGTSECLIPIPLHSSRLREREYNQALLLAQSVGHELHMQVVENLLVRSRATQSQTHLSFEERQKNVSGCFSAASHEFPKSILLIDDVFTTGATLAEAARSLRAHGAQSVSALVFAHD